MSQSLKFAGESAYRHGDTVDAWEVDVREHEDIHPDEVITIVLQPRDNVDRCVVDPIFASHVFRLFVVENYLPCTARNCHNFIALA